jgi:hypothetical protein
MEKSAYEINEGDISLKPSGFCFIGVHAGCKVTGL